MGLQLAFVAAQIGAECPVEAEQGAGGEAAFPKCLGVFETGQIESGVARLAVPPEVTMVEAGVRRGEVRARRKRSGGHGRQSFTNDEAERPKARAVIRAGGNDLK
jgi:hypothetical protein